MLVILIKSILPLLIVFNTAPLLVWLERKGSAYIQDRHGPNRAAIFGIRLGGMLHNLADVIKMLTKEDITPAHVSRPYFALAPFLALFVACLTYAVIPFAAPITVNGEVFTFQAADINVGILYILAMGSLGVFGIMLAGWASNNKYALLGGLRSSAQMFSYEIAMGLSILSVLLMAGSLELNDIILDQSSNPLHWNFIRMPLAFLIFLTSAFAETNRLPFDLPEGESEIVGYHVEYSSMKFLMFFMAEYAHIIIASALIVILFFGGWQLPFLPTEFLRANADIGLKILLGGHALVFILLGLYLLSKYRKRFNDNRDYEVLIFGLPLTVLGLGLALFTLFSGSFNLGDLGSQIFSAFVQFGFFMAKVLFFCWFFIWVRWTLPRFRYDQVMSLGWKYMIPLSLLNLALYGIGIYLFAS